MKKLKFLIFFASLVVFFALGTSVSAVNNNNKQRPFCLEIKGTYYAKNYIGGPIEVGCGGDWGHAIKDPKKRDAQSCKGEVQTVYPNHKFDLTACSCFGKKGCLFVGQQMIVQRNANKPAWPISVTKPLSAVKKFKNNNCVLKVGGLEVSNLTTGKTKVCGTNNDTLHTTIKITCNVPKPPATNTPTYTPTITPTVSITSTVTPTGVCVVPAPVLGVKITCPNCNLTATPTPVEIGGPCINNGGPGDAGNCATGLECQVNSDGGLGPNGENGTCINPNGGGATQ